MMHVQVVAPQYIYQIWHLVEGYFKAAEQYGVGDFTTDQLKLQLVSGAQVLLVAIDEDSNVHGAASMSVYNLPNHRVAVITAAGGEGITNPDVVGQVITWAKQQGATKLRMWAKDAQARLYKLKLKAEAVATVMDLSL